MRGIVCVLARRAGIDCEDMYFCLGFGMRPAFCSLIEAPDRGRIPLSVMHLYAMFYFLV